MGNIRRSDSDVRGETAVVMGSLTLKPSERKLCPDAGGWEGRESQAGDPPLAAGVFHEPALPCSPSPGRYLKQKHLRASMLLCGAIPDPTIFHSDGAPFSALFRRCSTWVRTGGSHPLPWTTSA